MIIYFNDLDLNTIYGSSTVGERESVMHDRRIRKAKDLEFLKTFVGTVIKVDNDAQTVDVQHGKVSPGVTRKQYINCRVLGVGGSDVDGNNFGFSQLPKVGTEVLCTFILGIEDQPIVMGGYSSKSRSNANTDNANNSTDKNTYYKNGKLIEIRKDTGDYILKNDGGARFDLFENGELILNQGGLGAARKLDETKITNITDNAFLTWTTVVSAFINAIAPGTVTPPTSMKGEITKASKTVKIGGDSG